MSPSTQTLQANYDATSRRIESQHDELLQKLDELDKQIEMVLAQWTPSCDAVVKGGAF